MIKKISVILVILSFIIPLGHFVTTEGYHIREATREELVDIPGTIAGVAAQNEKKFLSFIPFDIYILYPPWDRYGWDKTVQVWGGQEEWGARTQNITLCDMTPDEGYLSIESRAFGSKCLVTAWFGHFAQWQCPRKGNYDIIFNYTYYDGLSEAIYTIHEDFSGELHTEANLIFYYGDRSDQELVFARTGKHRNDGFQGNVTTTFSLSCVEGQNYLFGTNLSLMAYTDSWDEAWSSSKIQTRGRLNSITLERRNTPPGTPSRPVGVSMGTTGKPYTYASSAIDPDEDDLYYLFDWGDDTTSGWRGPYPSGTPGNASHTWHQGNFSIRVKVKDESGVESDWSDPLVISMPNRPVELMTGFIARVLTYFIKMAKEVHPLFSLSFIP